MADVCCSIKYRSFRAWQKIWIMVSDLGALFRFLRSWTVIDTTKRFSNKAKPTVLKTAANHFSDQASDNRDTDAGVRGFGA